MPKTDFTIIKSNSPANKVFVKGEDGKIKKISRGQIYQAQARGVSVLTPERMVMLLKQITNSTHEVLVPGTWLNAEQFDNKFNLITEAKLKEALNVDELPHGVVEINGQPFAARLKSGIKPSNWVLLDFDEAENFFPQFVGKSIGEKLEALEPIFPGISTCLRIEARSSSARVINGTGPKERSHAWIQVSDADKIEIFKAYFEVQSALHDFSFISPRRSRIDGQKIGKGSRRYMFDTSTLITGRIVYSNLPEISEELEGYQVVDAGIQIVNPEGGVFNIDDVQIPTKKMCSELNSKTGQEIEFSTVSGSLITVERNLLDLDTEIDVRGEVRTFGQWYEYMMENNIDKLRCEAPFRESSSEAGMIRIGDSGLPFVYDVVGVKYPLKEGTLLVNHNDFEGVAWPGEDEEGGQVAVASGRDLGDSAIKAIFGTKHDANEFPYIRTLKKSVTVYDHLSNYEHLLNKAGISVQYCQIRKKIIFKINGSELKASDNFDESMLVHIESLARLNDMNSRNVAGYIKAIADKHQINEVVDYLSAITWDGQDWVAKLVDGWDVDDKEEAALMMRIWLRQCCAAADAGEKGIAARERMGLFTKPTYESVIVVVGQQGGGKTKGLQSLLPKQLHKYFKDGLILDINNKDTLLEALSYWVTEMGELDATFSKSQIAALKAFISKAYDQIRTPYARTSSNFARRTSFCATCNEADVLRDRTGNRRYLVINADYLMHNLTPEQIDQVWGQAWAGYVAGEQWWATKEEAKVIAHSSEEATESNPYEDILRGMFNWNFDTLPGSEVDTYESRFTVTEILEYVHLVKERANSVFSMASPGSVLSIENAKLSGALKGNSTKLEMGVIRNYGYALAKLWSQCGGISQGGKLRINAKYEVSKGQQTKHCEVVDFCLVNAPAGSHRGWRLPE